MKSSIIALLVATTSAVTLQWGVKDMVGDGTESNFKLYDAQKEEEVDDTMESLREVEAEMGSKMAQPTTALWETINEANHKQ